ncbi:MAG: ATP-binding protein [Anaerolineaceae bacterium]
MNRSENRFAEILQNAIDRIAFIKKRTKQSIYDELGYDLGRQGGSAIQYWIYHHRIPAKMEDAESLARILYQLNGWNNCDEIIQFLQSAGHIDPEVFCAQNGFFNVSSENDATGDWFIPSTPAFVVGPPIYHPRQFFGRAQALQRIFQALQGPPLQNVALVGKQRSGKTSLLQYLRKITNAPSHQLRLGQQMEWLPAQQNYRWVFIDFQDPRVRTLQGFINFVLRELNFLPATPVDFAGFIELISTRVAAPTVFLMDEIQIAMQSPELNQPFWWGLRSLGTNLTEGKLGFVIASQKPSEELVSDRGDPSPFLNIFGHVIQLGPFDPDEALEMINSSPKPFDQNDIEWILEKSGYWPALLQILCQERLLSLTENNLQDTWKETALRRIAPYQHLLDQA